MEFGEDDFGSEERRTIDWMDYSIWPGPYDETVIEPGTVVKLKGSSQPFGVVFSYDPDHPEIVSVVDNMAGGGPIDRSLITTFDTRQIEVYSAS